MIYRANELFLQALNSILIYQVINEKKKLNVAISSFSFFASFLTSPNSSFSGVSFFFQVLSRIQDKLFKMARYSFSGSIPPKFENKLRRQNRSFGKIATTVVLDKDENLL